MREGVLVSCVLATCHWRGNVTAAVAHLCTLEAAVGMPPEPLMVAPMRVHMSGMDMLVNRGYVIDGQP